MFREMTEWPFSEHDDVPDAISDIDKKDKDGKFFCPAPPVGWRTYHQPRHQPTMIDGQYNPKLGYPARDALRRGDDLWKLFNQNEDNQSAPKPSQSIFRQQSNRGWPWRK
jgi:hypothetical protein